MKLIITGRHVEIPKKFTQYVRKRLAKWADFLNSQATVHVVVTVENYRHQVEITTQDGRHSFTAKQTTKDMYQSIDLLAEKFGRQLARRHEKRVDSKTSRVRPEPAVEPEPRPAEPEGPVIEVETLTGKPMTQEEAAIELQALRQPFLVFEDAESGQLAVITKQKNGTYRLIVKE